MVKMSDRLHAFRVALSRAPAAARISARIRFFQVLRLARRLMILVLDLAGAAAIVYAGWRLNVSLGFALAGGACLVAGFMFDRPTRPRGEPS